MSAAELPFRKMMKEVLEGKGKLHRFKSRIYINKGSIIEKQKLR